MRYLSKLLAGLAILAVVIAIPFCWWNLSNPETPAGYVGYVTQKPIFSQTKYVGLQVGHTSTGLSWRPEVINVSVTPYNMEEPFAGREGVVTADNIKVEYVVHVVWQVKTEKVREFVENYTTLLTMEKPTQENIDAFIAHAYDNNIKQPARTFSREEVERYKGLEVKQHLGEIGTKLEARLREELKDTPFNLVSVNVGSVQPPQSIVDVISGRLAKTQLLNQRLTEVEIAKKDKIKKVTDAKGVALAMDKINGELTEEYLLHEANEAQKKMVLAPNHSTLYVPQGVQVIIPVEKK